MWPPDAFAICGSLLKASGAYLEIFEKSGPSSKLSKSLGRGDAWRAAIDQLTLVAPASLGRLVPADVRAAWNRLLRHSDLPLGAIPSKKLLIRDLLAITLIADEASGGIGVDKEDTPFLMAARLCLEDNDLASFCWQVDRDFAGVLGKQHTLSGARLFVR